MAAALPGEIWKAVFAFIPDHQYAARCVCATWQKLLGDEAPKITPRTLLAAQSVEWLVTLTDIVDFDSDKADQVLFLAASEENISGMKLAKLLGASDFFVALEAAATRGKDVALKLVDGWAVDSQQEFQELYSGTEAYDNALASAATQGHLSTAGLLIDWGATNLDDALSDAAKCGQLEMIRLLKNRGATDFDSALTNAAMNGQVEAMALLVVLSGGLPSQGMMSACSQALNAAADNDQLAAMELLFRWMGPTAPTADIMRLNGALLRARKKDK